MEVKNRIIVALDVDSLDKVKPLVESLAPHVGYFKVGLELLTAVGAPKVVEFVHSLGGQIFFDGKFDDIPNTVARAARVVTRLGVKMFNVHCLGGIPMMRAAHEAVEAEWIEIERRKAIQGREPFVIKPPLILGVTILTSLSYDDLVDLAIQEELDIKPGLKLEEGKEVMMEALVVHLAFKAQEAKLGGVIASPKEIKAIRKKCGSGLIIITPGIRSSDAPPDDQNRTASPAEAIKAGATALVIGRPITNAKDPVEAAKRIAEEIYLADLGNQISQGQASPL